MLNHKVVFAQSTGRIGHCLWSLVLKHVSLLIRQTSLECFIPWDVPWPRHNRRMWLQQRLQPLERMVSCPCTVPWRRPFWWCQGRTRLHASSRCQIPAVFCAPHRRACRRPCWRLRQEHRRPGSCADWKRAVATFRREDGESRRSAPWRAWPAGWTEQAPWVRLSKPVQRKDAVPAHSLDSSPQARVCRVCSHAGAQSIERVRGCGGNGARHCSCSKDVCVRSEAVEGCELHATIREVKHHCRAVSLPQPTQTLLANNHSHCPQQRRVRAGAVLQLPPDLDHVQRRGGQPRDCASHTPCHQAISGAAH